VMLVSGPLSQVVCRYLDNPGGAGPFDNPVIDYVTKKVWKDRDDVDS